MSLSMGISDEIKDAMIAIDETHLRDWSNEFEIITFGQNIDKVDLKDLTVEIISHLIHNQT